MQVQITFCIYEPIAHKQVLTVDSIFTYFAVALDRKLPISVLQAWPVVYIRSQKAELKFLLFLAYQFFNGWLNI